MSRKAHSILNIFTVVCAICASPNLYAVKGKYIPNADLPAYVTENICVVIKDDVEVCSGTRTSENTIYSAAHCGDQFGETHNSTYSVKCGTNPTEFKVDFQSHASFRMNLAEYTTRAGIDIAKATGKFTIEYGYIKLFNFNELDNLRGLECIVGGFGYDNAGIRGHLNFISVNELVSSQIEMGAGLLPDKSASDSLKPETILTFHIHPMPSTHTDSGGPVLCKQDNEYKLFAITSGPFMGYIPLISEYLDSFESGINTIFKKFQYDKN